MAPASKPDRDTVATATDGSVVGAMHPLGLGGLRRDKTQTPAKAWMCSGDLLRREVTATAADVIGGHDES